MVGQLVGGQSGVRPRSFKERKRVKLGVFSNGEK